MRRIAALIALICCLLSIPFAGLAPSAGAAAPVDALTPLPKGCGTGLPPNASVPACCMFGYVFMDGAPVANAFVAVYVPGTDRYVDTWTALGPDSDLPYFRLSLSAPPLSVQAGETIEIYASYASHAVTTSHTVIGGGQEVDLVIPSAASGADYVVEREIYGQEAPGDLHMNFGDVAIDGGDTLYVTDWGNQRVQVFNKNGTFIRQWGRLGGGEGQFISPSAVAVDNQGFVYVADYGEHMLSVFTSTGEFVRRWGEAGSQPGMFAFPLDVLVDGDGLVYVADSGNDRIQVFDRDGGFVRAWGSSGGGSGQLSSPGGLALGPDGYLYVADSDNGRVQVFTRSGSFVRAWPTAGTPGGLTFSASGQLYVSDRQGNVVRRYTSAGVALDSFGGPGVELGSFNGVNGLAFDSAGELYVADSYNDRVQIFSSAGAFRRSFGQSGQSLGRIDYPGGLAFDTAGTIYVSEQTAGIIRRFDADGNPLSSLGGGWGDGPGQLVWAHRLAVAADGSIYIADSGNNRVQQLSASGAFIRQWGGYGSGPGQLNNPYALALAPGGDVYVADSDNHRVQQFSPTGGFIRQWGGYGSAAGQLDSPLGIAVAPGGDVYVADTNNHRVQQFSPAGAFIRQWGEYGYGLGQLVEPVGIAVGPGGVVYVAEYGAYRFQRFSPSGQWLSSFGWASPSAGGVHQPNDIDVLPDGRVYLVEPNLSRAQLLRPTSYTRPIATIVAANPPVVSAGQAVELLGRGADSNSQSALSFEWRLGDSTQPFASTASASLDTSGLAPGDYSVSLRVRDAQGEISDPRTVTISVAQSVDAPPQRWTFLLYLAGDNNLDPLLGNDQWFGALARLRSRAGPANVTVAALFDGQRGGDSARYLLRPGQPAQITSLGELNSGDPQTLADFIAWGRQVAPADAYYLAIADHGNALDGVGWDYTSDPGGRERLSNPELRQALIAATDGGAHPVDVLHFDACLMGLLETAYQMRGMARYLVVSENLAWSSFGYEDYRALVGPGTSARNLALGVAASYAATLTAAGLPFTISALDMSRLDAAALAADDLAQAQIAFSLGGASNRAALTALRAQVQKLDSSNDGALTASDEYVDLDHWAELLAGSGALSAELRARASALRAALRSFVLSAQHQSGQAAVPPSTVMQPINLDSARGLAIYYPQQPGVSSYQDYQRNLEFAAATSWDEWLQSQLTALGAVEPARAPSPAAPLPYEHTFSIALPFVRR